jgi:hypothetical protein
MSIATLIRMGPWLAILALLFVNTVTDRSRDKWRGQAQGLSAELKRISTAKDRQAETTKQSVIVFKERNSEAERVAKKIEAAPPTLDCKTPEIILGADL